MEKSEEESPYPEITRRERSQGGRGTNFLGIVHVYTTYG